jgi:fused signal recognition particle receptor
MDEVEAVVVEEQEHHDQAQMDGLGLSPLFLGSGIGGAFVSLLIISLVLRRIFAPSVEPAVEGPVEEEASVVDEVPIAERPTEISDDEPLVPSEVPTAVEKDEAVGLVARLRQTLGRSRAVLQERFDQIFGRPIDETLFTDLEEALLIADVGMPTTNMLIDQLRQLVKKGEADSAVLRAALKEHIRAILAPMDPSMPVPKERPYVILVVGVNGSGKTTTIGKLAAKFADDGLSVLLAAGDTYRAAASEQLKIWAERAGADFVSHEPGADPGAVVYDALEAARSRGRDVVIVDTAGRLQTRRPLMEQLGKMRRVITKLVPSGPHETLLVVDGTMGQNALSQTKIFNEVTPLSGVVVTKLDGTAKGGMILTISAELQIPIKFIGIGEKIDDLRPFEADAFVEVLA